MSINDLPKDIKTYEKIVAKALGEAPPCLTAKPLIDGYKLSFRVYFKGEQTPFYITQEAKIVYFDPDDEVLKIVSREILLLEYDTFKKSSQEEEGLE